MKSKVPETSKNLIGVLAPAVFRRTTVGIDKQSFSQKPDKSIRAGQV